MIGFVRSHHERWDGTGYPDRLAGEAIPLGARIIGAVEIYDALTTARPYQEKMRPKRRWSGCGIWSERCRSRRSTGPSRRWSLIGRRWCSWTTPASDPAPCSPCRRSAAAYRVRREWSRPDPHRRGRHAGGCVLTVLAWLLYTAYLDRVERRLAARKGLYRELVSELATRDRALLEPTINQMSTLYDLDALEAVLEEQARSATGRPAGCSRSTIELGLVDKYIDKLRTARKWRDRAFAAELLGRVGSAKAVPALLETVQATQN